MRDSGPYGHNIEPGTDLTGNGIPDLIIEEHSGGAHCCVTYTIFELHNGSAELVTEIYSRNSHVRFEDLDQDEDYEAVFVDDTFAYWETSYADSPMPRVVLAYDGTTYTPAPVLMAAPPPAQGEWDQRVQEVRTSLIEYESLWRSSALWGTMLDLIYTGHPGLAWRFLDEAWPAERPGKQTFVDNFRAQLDKSPYREALRIEP